MYITRKTKYDYRENIPSYRIRENFFLHNISLYYNYETKKVLMIRNLLWFFWFPNKSLEGMYFF